MNPALRPSAAATASRNTSRACTYAISQTARRSIVLIRSATSGYRTSSIYKITRRRFTRPSRRPFRNPGGASFQGSEKVVQVLISGLWPQHHSTCVYVAFCITANSDPGDTFLHDYPNLCNIHYPLRAWEPQLTLVKPNSVLTRSLVHFYKARNRV
jgi:hypothetical protein